MTGGGLPGASPLPSLAEEGGSGGSVGMNSGMSSGMVPGTTNTLAGGTVLPLSRSNVMLMNIPEGDESTGELFSKKYCLNSTMKYLYSSLLLHILHCFHWITLFFYFFWKHMFPKILF